MRTLKLIGISMFVIAFLISLQQYMVWGDWFTIDQIHHESFIIAFAFAGLVVIILSFSKKKILTGDTS